MIERYTLPEMADLWGEDEKYHVWLEIELLACEAWARQGKIPAKALQNIRSKAQIDPERIAEIEAEVKHDVIAFTTCLAEVIGPDSRFVHMGLTSMDVVDTAFSVRTVRAMDLILAKTDDLIATLQRQAVAHKSAIMMGRTHGMHAEPISLGLKFLIWLDEFRRHRTRLRAARDSICVGKISGAVGTYAHTGPEIERYVCEKLGLQPAKASSQILQRDRHAEVLCAIAQAGASLEKIAVEIRNLQRTEIGEAEEPFSKGQKGSSAMPHKRNPISSENVTGLARLLRGYAVAGLETVALWHERDLSNSSCERVTIPDATTLLHYMLNRMNSVVKSLEVYPERMRENMELTLGLCFSQRVMLALVDKGLTREQAYAMTQRSSMAAWAARRPLRELLLEDPDLAGRLSAAELDKIMDYGVFLRYIDVIYEQCLGAAESGSE
ncbi:MAG: adenylosuccinate lyase [Candidatus Sumerlaeota bacterium]|nr:adenylosuccinate lyase [Candidatus Sumerlaeota bacterium]